MNRLNLTKIAVAAGAGTAVAAPIVAAYRIVTRHKVIALTPVVVWLTLTYLPPGIVHQKLTAPPAYSQAEHDKATAEAVTQAREAVAAQAQAQIDAANKATEVAKAVAVQEQANSARAIKERADAEAKLRKAQEAGKKKVVEEREAPTYWEAYQARSEKAVAAAAPRRMVKFADLPATGPIGNTEECKAYRKAEARGLSSISMGYFANGTATVAEARGKLKELGC